MQVLSKKRVLSEIEKLIARCESDESRERLITERESLNSGRSLDSRDKYLGIIYKECENLISYFLAMPRAAVFVIGSNEVREDAKRRIEAIGSMRRELIEAGLVSEGAAKYIAPESELDRLFAESVTVHINPFAGGVGNLRTSGLFGFRCRRTIAYGGNPSLLFEDVKAFRKGGYRTLIMTDTKGGADSLVASLQTEEIAARAVYSDESFDISSAEGGSVFVGVGVCEGFDLIVPKIAVLSMARPEGRVIMEKRRQKRVLRRVGGAGQRLMSYADLSLGDYVVHANYGIGQFEGIEAVTVDGVTKDYITIRYAGTDKLFVPCDRLELIGKYIGQKDDNGTVKLSKMGGGDWTRAKTRAKSAAKDIAKDLIRL